MGLVVLRWHSLYDTVDIGLLTCCPSYPELRILLLCGSDLLESFCIPGLWNESDVSIVPYVV